MRNRERLNLAVRCLAPLALAAMCCMAVPARADENIHADSIGLLNRLSDSVQSLAGRVSPSVVKIIVTRYGPQEESRLGETNLVFGKQQSVGSGVIVDENGFIVTNAHVVAGAQSIRVSVSPRAAQSPMKQVAQPYTAPYTATLIGIFKEADLALLKIDGEGLPALPFANYELLRQGQVVFAFGSPGGLENSMSMGVVSAVARQPDRDSPFTYIQTDAPINPGNSGGPLVNANGQLAGINTFILSQSGGSEGIGFAIPSALVNATYRQLRKYGHMHRPEIGVSLQTITPPLAAALGLPRTSGVVISDVFPGSAAEGAGLKIKDVVLAVDNWSVDSLPGFLAGMFEHSENGRVQVHVLRGREELTLDVAAADTEHTVDRLSEFSDPVRNLIPRLGVLVVGIDRRTQAMVGKLRIGYGVIVAGRAEDPSRVEIGLQAGDVIHALNGSPIATVEALQSAAARIQRGDPVALDIEREGKLLYLAFEME
jgi:serine protease Do